MRSPNRCGAAALAAAMLLPAAASAAQSSTTPLEPGRPPLSPTSDRPFPLPDPQIAAPSPARTAPQGRPDIAIRKVRFIGAGVPANVAKAAERYIGRPASTENLKRLAAAMTRAYNRSSVALFTLVIPEQDFADGVVTVASAEGHISRVTISGDAKGGPAPLIARMAAPLPGQAPLPRARFERALGTIADIPGTKVTPTLALGDSPGAVALDLAVDASRPTLGVGFTTRSSPYVRDGIVEATARGYSLLRSGDESQLGGAAAVDFKSLLYITARHSTPLGAAGTRAELSVAALRTRPRALAIDGKAWSGGLAVTHPLIRSTRRTLTLSGRLDYLDSRNALFGTTLAAEKSWTASGALAFRLTEDRSVVGAHLGVSRGLDIAGAHVDPAVGEAGFLHADAAVEANQAVGKRVVLRAAATGRWTRDRLPAAQRFSVGGASFGRAFDDGLVSGDRGYAGFGELALRPLAKGALAKSEVYAFADYADVTLLARPTTSRSRFDLGSWGGGVRLSYRDNATIGVEFADAWNQPTPGFDQGWRVALAWKVSIRP
ncbi:ShlB/FhaC/HecB family hemolysin secretion/activation protein [Sphingopyxis sp. GC21]|uniref:ShlB/FhaC/HecB family hemolysin secretion/activation protein n=1 Tax=Sphingopyxis sp. GC21 TaxID=2933562 RepID=UPI0021E48466|nr:ShlB/FhaC/HecB family hemolysin secretion/activation protein [Sphingopyxis sp. GC21]